jgi:hypothetical protein
MFWEVILPVIVKQTLNVVMFAISNGNRQAELFEFTVMAALGFGLLGWLNCQAYKRMVGN